jgi:hypothetical protein
MKKRILVLIAMLFVVCGSMFAQNSFDKNTFLNSFLIKMGNSYAEFIKINGKPVKEYNIEIDSRTTVKFLMYPSMQVSILTEGDLEYLNNIEIFDPSFEIAPSVSVGSNITDVEKIIGKSYKNSGGTYYFGHYNYSININTRYKKGIVTSIYIQNGTYLE